jgi:hypothetical protein
MEIATWHLFAIVLLIIVLAIVLIVIVLPTIFGINQTGTEINVINACREWSKSKCSEASVSVYKSRIGCKDYEECLRICRNLGTCW